VSRMRCSAKPCTADPGLDQVTTAWGAASVCKRRAAVAGVAHILKNRAKDLIALDFFTVLTATFRVLFVLVMLTHSRRRLVHFNVTEHPTAEWTARQLLEACALEDGRRYLIRDRDQV
jgi:hypothetical protein